MKQKIYDVLVIGAGPAGSASAITLAKQGYSVLIVDQCSFPREKVCGDGLIGDSLNMLKKLGIWSKVEALSNKSDEVISQCRELVYFKFTGLYFKAGSF